MPEAVLAPISSLLSDPERKLTPQETTLVLGLASPQTLAAWRSSGRYNLPFIRIGKAIRYRAGDVRDWLNSRTTVPA